MGQPSGSVDQSAAITLRRRNDPEAMEGVEGAGLADGLRTPDHMTVHDIECIHTLIEDMRTDGNNVVAIERSHLTVRTTLAGGSNLEEAADLNYLKSKMAELRKTFECHGMGEVINIQAGSLLIILRINGLDEIHSLQTGTYLDVGKKKLQDVLTKGREDRDASNADIGGLSLKADEQDLEQARHFFLTDQITVPVKFLFCHERRCWYWTLDMEILHGLDVFSVQAGTHVGRRLVVRLVELVRKIRCASTAPSKVEPRPCLICESRADFKYDKERPFGDKEAAVTPNSPIQETVGSAEHREDGDPDAGAAAADHRISVEETQPPGDFEPAGQQLSPEEVNEWINDVRPRQIADGRIGHGMQSNVRFNAPDLSSNAPYDVDNYPRQPLSDWLGIVDLHRLSEGSLLLPIVLLSREELKTIQCQDVQQMLLKRMRKLLIEQRKAGGISVGALESLTIEISPEDIDKLEHFYAADPIPLPASYVFCGETCYWYWTADGDIFHRVDVCQVAAGKYKGQRLREHEIQLCWKLWQLTEGPLKDHNRCPVCKHRKSNDGHIFPKEAAEKPEAHGSSTSTTVEPGHKMQQIEALTDELANLRATISARSDVKKGSSTSTTVEPGHKMQQIEALADELANLRATISARSDVKKRKQIARGSYGRVLGRTLKEGSSTSTTVEPGHKMQQIEALADELANLRATISARSDVKKGSSTSTTVEPGHKDAAAYGGLRVTGVVGEEAGPGRLQWPRGVAAHGDLVWVTDRRSHMVVVFRRTTEGGHTAHRYVAQSPVQSPECIAATDTEVWICQDNGQLQGVQLVGGEVVLTRTLPTTERLKWPAGLAYRESTRTLYVCCTDGVVVVDVAGGGVVATLNTPPEVERWRPWFVSVLQDTILVAYGFSRLVLYTGDGAPGRVLNLSGLSPRDITHNGEHFVVCDWGGGSLLVVSREGEAVTRVTLEGEAVTRVRMEEMRPWCISWPPHHHLLYVTDHLNNKLFVVSR